ncbi:hypothetical protein EZV62_012355 [Acer yangbiense]|uniref:BED-type domain-containing protein n=1 Tax=Acer yangbiense TaxID=1000413 RepID=A0A5C7HXW3_9ROSI|nr:hypothetical protein EZV62_012355 [Acer yangbiense]
MSSQPKVNSNNVVNIEESSTQPNSEDQVGQRKRKFRSQVWEHYQFVSVNGVEKAVCNYCKHGYAIGSGTKGLIDHQKTCKMRFGQRRMDLYQSHLSGKMAKGDSGSSCLTLATQHFDSDVSKVELSRMIVLHDYPLSMVDHLGFRDFTRSLQPLFKPISRQTIRKDIMSMYEEERARSLSMLGKIPGRIAITSDLLTASNQKRGYMTVTSHFIDESWQLQSRLLSGLDVIESGIERIRDSVAFWTATPKRMEKFEKAAEQLNLGQKKRLVLDCKTRWNSTYLMLSVALTYKDVFYRLKQRDSQYRTIIEESDWDLTKEMCETESLDGFFSWDSKSSDVNEKSELDCYLEEKTLPRSHEFDILGWWKLNGIKYPIMSEIARDILAILISMVASESSFSTSGNIVDGVGDVQVDDDNDNEANEVAVLLDCWSATAGHGCI